MVTVSISLPESMKSFVDAQAAAAGYANSDEYVRALIRDAQKAHERSALEAKLLAGIEELDRGEGKEMTSEDWKRLRKRVSAKENHAK